MGARSDMAKKTKEKAAEIVASLPPPVAKRSDAEIAADIKQLVNALTALMNEGEASGLSVNFNIGKVGDNKFFTVTQLTINKAIAI